MYLLEVTVSALKKTLTIWSNYYFFFHDVTQFSFFLKHCLQNKYSLFTFKKITDFTLLINNIIIFTNRKGNLKKSCEYFFIFFEKLGVRQETKTFRVKPS